MKKISMILLSLSASIVLMAQENPKQQELGLIFKNLDSFGLSYKVGSEKSLWRFNTLLLAGGNTNEVSDSSDFKSNYMGFSLAIGKEYRKAIADNFELRFGADIFYRYTRSKNETTDKTIYEDDRYYSMTTHAPGIKMVLGFNYVMNGHIVLGAELLPSINYRMGSVEETNYYDRTEDNIVSDISGFYYGLSNTSALLTMAYRF